MAVFSNLRPPLATCLMNGITSVVKRPQKAVSVLVCMAAVGIACKYAYNCHVTSQHTKKIITGNDEKKAARENITEVEEPQQPTSVATDEPSQAVVPFRAPKSYSYSTTTKPRHCTPRSVQNDIVALQTLIVNNVDSLSYNLDMRSIITAETCREFTMSGTLLLIESTLFSTLFRELCIGQLDVLNAQRKCIWPPRKASVVDKGHYEKKRIVGFADPLIALRDIVIRKLKERPLRSQALLTWAPLDDSKDVQIQAEPKLIFKLPSFLSVSIWRFLEGNPEFELDGDLEGPLDGIEVLPPSRLIDIYEPVGERYDLYNLFTLSLETATVEPWEEDSLGDRAPFYSRLRERCGFPDNAKITIPTISHTLRGIKRLPKTIVRENMFSNHTAPILSKDTVTSLIVNVILDVVKPILQDNDTLDPNMEDEEFYDLPLPQIITLMKTAIPSDLTQVPSEEWPHDPYLDIEQRHTNFIKGKKDVRKRVALSPPLKLSSGKTLKCIMLSDSTSPMLGQDDYERLQNEYFLENKCLPDEADLKEIRKSAMEATKHYTTLMIENVIKKKSYTAERDSLSERDCHLCQEIDFFEPDEEGNDPIATTNSESDDGVPDASSDDAEKNLVFKQLYDDVKAENEFCDRHAKKHVAELKADGVYKRFPLTHIASHIHFTTIAKRISDEKEPRADREKYWYEMSQKSVDRIWRWTEGVVDQVGGDAYPIYEDMGGLQDVDVKGHGELCGGVEGKRICRCQILELEVDGEDEDDDDE